MRRLMGAVAAGMALATAAFPVGTGNDGFEAGTDDSAMGWGTNLATPPGQLRRLRQADAFEGEYLLSIVTTEGQTHQLYPERHIDVIPQDRLEMEIWARGNGRFRLGVYAYAEGNRMVDGNFSEALQPAGDAAEKWQRFHFSWEAQEGGQIVTIAPVLLVEPDSKLEFDALALTLGAPGELPISATVRGSNTDPSPASEPGAKPYEMAERNEVRPPLADFTDCEAWVVENCDSDAAIYRTTDQRLFRPYAGKLTYRAAGVEPVITVRPVQPVPIPEPWDTVECWNWGNVWCWVGGIPRLSSAVLVTGADGVEYEIPFEVMFYEYWHLQRRRIHRDIPRPATFTGLRFTGGTNRKPMSIYLDSVSFYRQEEEPLHFAPLPEERPFPTTADTILPTNYNTKFVNEAEKNADGSYRLSYRDDNDLLIYQIDPAGSGALAVTAQWGERRLRLFENMSVLLADGSTGEWRDAGSDWDGERLLLRRGVFAGDRQVTALELTLQIRGKSLLIDWREVGQEGQIDELAIGRIGGVRTPRLIEVPYISYGWEQTAPRVLADEGLFVFAHFDWFHSDAGAFFALAENEADKVRINGGVRYPAKTDGKRNPLRERLFVNISDDFTEILPNIPNPASPLQEMQGNRLWRIRPGVNYHEEITQAQRLRRLGMSQVTIRYHEGTWRDGGESYTFKTTAAPGRGGDAALKNLVDEIQSLGWLAGLYTNYTDFAPVNAQWDPDGATQDSNGDWVTGWARCYNPKPRWIVEEEARLAPEISAKFGNRHVYCDVHTAVAPWIRTDYDARVPDAGKFRAVFECFGLMLLNEREAYQGPVYSEGGVHWMYAGLTDGNYAQLFVPRPMEMPLLPDFDLLKLHELSMDAGMGSPDMFYRGQTPNLDQYIATSLAYGHIGCLEGSEAELLRLYYIFQALQPHYVMEPVESIAWADDDNLYHTTSEALTRESIWQAGRLRVRYANGLEVYVNSNPAKWQPEKDLPELPQWGWLLRRDGQILGTRQWLDGEIVEYAQGAESVYLRAPERQATLGTVAGLGAAALKVEGEMLYLIPMEGFAWFAFEPSWLGGVTDETVRIELLDANDAVRRSFDAEIRDGRIMITDDGDTEIFRYRIQKIKK